MTVNQIDHVLVNGDMRTSILETRVMRGADVYVYTNHYLVKTRILLKLARAEGRKNVRERLDVSKLKSKEIRRRYNIEVTNRFEALGDIVDPEEEHDMILATYRDAAKKVLGRSKKLSRPWTGNKTLEKIKERKEAKLKLESTYLGAIVVKEGRGSKDIMRRLPKARGALQRLRRVWAARGIGRRTKIRL